MKFGPIPVTEAVGAILAHSLPLAAGRMKKGRRLSAIDVERLRDEGYQTVTVAILEPGDLDENDAAKAVATALVGPGVALGTPGTGRCNLVAEADGLVLVDRDAVAAVNRVDEGITLATLAPFSHVTTGQLIATVKIIPFGVARTGIERCCERVAATGTPPVGLARFRSMSAALIETRIGPGRIGLHEKTVRTTRERLSRIGSSLVTERLCDHEAGPVADELRRLATGHDIILLLGASAVADRRDVLPAALEQAGGRILHFGLPVDPGNLTLIGRLGERWVVGMPGSARSPREQGFDWIIERIAADLPLDEATIAAMGVGGLLREIPGRPMPRAAISEPAPEPDADHRIAGLILAAGQSRRMGGINKLLAEVDGKPLVRHIAEAATGGGLDEVVVVTGHEAERIAAVLGDLPVRFVHNPDYREGLSTSLRAGLQGLPPETDGALVCLGDMPGIDAALLTRLAAAFDPASQHDIVVPVRRGKRGNPVLWGRRHFTEMQAIEGDVGARHLIGAHAEAVVEVDCDSDAVLVDLDTPEALRSYRNRPGNPG